MAATRVTGCFGLVAAIALRLVPWTICGSAHTLNISGSASHEP